MRFNFSWGTPICLFVSCERQIPFFDRQTSPERTIHYFIYPSLITEKFHGVYFYLNDVSSWGGGNFLSIGRKLSYFSLHASAISLPVIGGELCRREQLISSTMLWKNPTHSFGQATTRVSMATFTTTEC